MRQYKADENIKSTLAYEAKNIEVSPDLFNKIRKNIYEEEQKTMKSNIFGRGKRLSLIIVVCLLAGSITAIAAGISGEWTGHSRTGYTTFPTQQQVKKDNGFVPKYVESLPGGFKFKEAAVGESELTDNTGKKVTKVKDIDFYYVKEGEGRLNLCVSTSLIDEEYVNDHHLEEKIFNYEGVDLYLFDKPWMFVPEDYTPTAEEKAAIEKEELLISYGADEVTTEHAQHISWYENGISYQVIVHDYDFTRDELIEIAKTIIDVK